MQSSCIRAYTYILIISIYIYKPFHTYNMSMVKQHLNLSVDEYVLTKLKERGISNFSAFFEMKAAEFLNINEHTVRQCLDCKTFFDLDTLAESLRCACATGIPKTVVTKQVMV